MCLWGDQGIFHVGPKPSSEGHIENIRMTHVTHDIQILLNQHKELILFAWGLPVAAKPLLLVFDTVGNA